MKTPVSRLAAAALSAAALAFLTAGCHDDMPPPATIAAPSPATAVAPSPAATAASDPSTMALSHTPSTSVGAAGVSQRSAGIIPHRQVNGTQVKAVSANGLVTRYGQQKQKPQQKAPIKPKGYQAPGIGRIRNKIKQISGTAGRAKPKPLPVKAKTLAAGTYAPATPTKAVRQ